MCSRPPHPGGAGDSPARPRCLGLRQEAEAEALRPVRRRGIDPTGLLHYHCLPWFSRAVRAAARQHRGRARGVGSGPASGSPSPHEYTEMPASAFASHVWFFSVLNTWCGDRAANLYGTCVLPWVHGCTKTSYMRNSKFSYYFLLANSSRFLHFEDSIHCWLVLAAYSIDL